MHRRNEDGIALLTTMLLLLLTSTLLVGFTVMVSTDQHLSGIDQDHVRAVYAAHAGIERLTTDLGELFSATYAPTGTQINALTATPPSLPGMSFISGPGGPGYQITFPTDQNGNPTAEVRNIMSGPYQGFVGLVTPYQMTVTAQSASSSEVSLRRTLQTVSIPVFQFGVFSETDLSFFAGPDFNFGGRVHTNGNVFLADGATLTMADRVTAVGEVIRTNLSNGWPTSSGYSGQVNVITAPGVFRNLDRDEGSLVGTLGSAENEPTWTNLSVGTYNGNIRNGRTGTRPLNLALVALGGQPIDLLRRPAVGEDLVNPLVLAQRHFAMASLRILISDTANDITSLPTVSPTAPVALDNLAVTPIAGYGVDATHPPLAISSGSQADGYRSPNGTSLHGGFLKIDMQTQAGNWQDVTLEILNLGIAGRNLSHTWCTAEPNPDAVIRIQRVRDNPTMGGSCGVGSTAATDYWPNVLYDTREGNARDTIATTTSTVFLGGVMHYVELDVGNLSRWFQGAIGASGPNAMNLTGYLVYFSDRRGNRDQGGLETGEYGFEDFINPASQQGTPNGALDQGEDLNGNLTLEVYGENPVILPGATAPLDAASRPWTAVAPAIARVNRPPFFRRALKLVNGRLGNIVGPGLTVTSENPAYIQGDYNASAQGGFGNPHVACSVIADAVTLLSNSWSDKTSFDAPHAPSGRPATTTWYRTAIIAGKGRSFPRPTNYSNYQDFGTDGGVHNFLRFLEDWGGRTLNYRGSLASFFFNRQGVGIYKCCTNVYSPPTRGFNFDVDFLQPMLLPPRTPMFRDVNATGFVHLIRPD